MRCPVDNETLVMADRGGIEIDYCPKCRGVWLDRGELDKIIERSAGASVAKAAAVATPRPARAVPPPPPPMSEPPPVPHVAPIYQPEPQRPPQDSGPESRLDASRSDRRRRRDDDDDEDDDDDDKRRGPRKKHRSSFLAELFDF